MIEMWTVYDHPSDYPDKYVARRFEGESPTKTLIMGDDIEALRGFMVSMGLTCLTRREGDDPCIMETWL